MSAEIPSKEPESILAGDTLSWTKSLSDYPATSWTLTYYLRGPAAITITATASGSDHSVSVAATTTTNYVAGDYILYGFASNATERYKVFEGACTILPNVASQTGAVDVRSKARQILDALLDLQIQRASRPDLGYSVQAAGRSFTFKSDKDLKEAIQFWQSEVARVEGGSATSKDIVVHFR